MFYIILLFLDPITTIITIGIPSIEAIELIGSTDTNIGIFDITSQSNIMTTPTSDDPIISTLWQASLNIIRAICGATIPINAIGPQKAVIPPAKIAVARKIKALVCVTLSPKVRA